MTLLNSVVLAIIALPIWATTATGEPVAGYPPPATDLIELEKQVTEQVAEIRKMGPFCSGGGRKWAKIESLRLMHMNSEAGARVRKASTDLDATCNSVAVSSRESFDAFGNEPVIPQRVHRLKTMQEKDKKACLQFWSDWFKFRRIEDYIVDPVLLKFESDCKAGSSSVTGEATPAATSPANR